MTKRRESPTIPRTAIEEGLPVDRLLAAQDRGVFSVSVTFAKLSPQGYEEISRAHLLEPTQAAFGRDVVWCQPAYADRSIFVRNDKELIRVSLAK